LADIRPEKAENNARRSSDVIIMGTGAAGLMCAIEAGKHGSSVLVLDTVRRSAKESARQAAWRATSCILMIILPLRMRIFVVLGLNVSQKLAMEGN
jgi:2-polyprenyl-6-methoxyphenol hydroxylase-like FAD-dependent oxidoreductase